MDWYPWFPTHYKRDTLHLTLAEDGAYRRLIDEYMMHGQPIPDDDHIISRLIGISINEWMEVAPKVRSFFATANDGKLHHKRCDVELRRQERSIEQRKMASKKGVAVRKKNKENKPVQPSGLSPGQPSGQPTDNRAGQPDKIREDSTSTHQRSSTSSARAREGDADAQDDFSRIMEALDVDEARCPISGVDGALVTWKHSGFDLELDIIPAIRDVRRRMTPEKVNTLRSLSYFTSAIREQHERRQAGGGLSPNGSAPRALDESERLMQDSIDRRAGERIEKLHNLGIKIPTKKGQEGFDLIWGGTDKEFDEWAKSHQAQES